MTPAVAVLSLLLQVSANAELKYRLTVPDGFSVFPEGRSQQDVVDCWTENSPASAGGALVLCVQRMRATIGRERMKQADIPGGSRLMTFKWKAFDIDGVRTDTAQAGSPISVVAAQVPLKPEAVQLIVAGPRDQADRAEAIMASTLATLEGETNWLTDEERAGRLGTIAGWWIFIAVAALIGLWIRKRRSRAA